MALLQTWKTAGASALLNTTQAVGHGAPDEYLLCPPAGRRPGTRGNAVASAASVHVLDRTWAYMRPGLLCATLAVGLRKPTISPTAPAPLAPLFVPLTNAFLALPSCIASFTTLVIAPDCYFRLRQPSLQYRCAVFTSAWSRVLTSTLRDCTISDHLTGSRQSGAPFAAHMGCSKDGGLSCNPT